MVCIVVLVSVYAYSMHVCVCVLIHAYMLSRTFTRPEIRHMFPDVGMSFTRKLAFDVFMLFYCC